MFFLAGLVLLHESVIFLQAVQIALWGLAAFLAGRIARAALGPAAAGATVLLCLANPVFAFAATTLFPQTLSAVLLLAALLVLARRAPPPGWPETVAAAACMAALVLVNPLTLPFAVLVPLLLVWMRRASWLQAVVVWALPALAVGLWMLRNDMVMQSGFVLATNQGINLLLGNSPLARPDLGVNTDIAVYLRAAEGLGEVARDRYFQHAALDWMRSNPDAALRLYLGKLASYVSVSDTLQTESQASHLRTLALGVTYYGLLSLAVLGVAVSAARRRLSRVEVLLVVLYIAVGLAYSVFFNRVRFRIPADYMLAVIAGGGLAGLCEWVNGAVRRAPRPQPPTGPVLVEVGAIEAGECDEASEIVKRHAATLERQQVVLAQLAQDAVQVNRTQPQRVRDQGLGQWAGVSRRVGEADQLQARAELQKQVHRPLERSPTPNVHEVLDQDRLVARHRPVERLGQSVRPRYAGQQFAPIDLGGDHGCHRLDGVIDRRRQCRTQVEDVARQPEIDDLTRSVAQQAVRAHPAFGDHVSQLAGPGRTGDVASGRKGPPPGLQRSHRDQFGIRQGHDRRHLADKGTGRRIEVGTSKGFHAQRFHARMIYCKIFVAGHWITHHSRIATY